MCLLRMCHFGSFLFCMCLYGGELLKHNNLHHEKLVIFYFHQTSAMSNSCDGETFEQVVRYLIGRWHSEQDVHLYNRSYECACITIPVTLTELVSCLASESNVSLRWKSRSHITMSGEGSITTKWPHSSKNADVVKSLSNHGSDRIHN